MKPFFCFFGGKWRADLLKIPQEAKYLIGFWVTKGSAQPKKSPSQWMRNYAQGKCNYWGEGFKSLEGKHGKAKSVEALYYRA